jgi:photosystem II stability/assembly factor-like uncharacterized protein
MTRRNPVRTVLAAWCVAAACVSTVSASVDGAGGASALSARPIAATHVQRTMLMAVTRAGARLVAVGEHGGVALSDDNGATWRNAAAVPVDATLTAVRFADARIGWAVGHLGVVLRTDDGGEHWRVQLDGVTLAKLALQQAGRDTAEAQRLAAEGPDKPWLDLVVEDDQRVTVVGAFNHAVRSQDGGRDWRLASGMFANPNRMHWYGITRVSGRLVGVGEQAVMAAQAEPGPDAPLKAVKAPYDGSLFGALAAGDQALLVYGLRGHAFLSRDGGTSWQRCELGGSGASINAGLRLADGRIALGDQAGNLFLSADGGVRFERIPFGWGAPLTGIAEAADGRLVLTSLGGIATVPRSALDAVKAHRP